MTSTVDIITYVGVPLAVLGVFPLIFNMCKSLYIWHTLLSSISQNARDMFHLSIDPVGGTIACSMDDMCFSPIKLRMLLDTGKFPAYPRSLKVTETQGLCASWMGLLDLGRGRPLDRVSSLSRQQRRCVIDISLRTDITYLTFDSQAFIHFALALGVAPGDIEGAWPSISGITPGTITLQEVFGAKREVMRLSHSSDIPIALLSGSEVTFSVRRMLAWELIMVLPRNHGVSVEPLLEEKDLDMEKIANSSHTLAGFVDTPHSGWQYDLSKARNEIEATLVWCLYVEWLQHWAGDVHRESLPVPQYMLKVRRVAIEDLKKLPNGEELLKKIFNSKPAIAQEILTELQKLATHNLLKPCLGMKNSTSPAYMNLRTSIWTDIQQTEDFKILMTAYGPERGSGERKPIDELKDMKCTIAVLARVIIALSSIQEWPQDEWPWVVDPNTGHNVPDVPKPSMISLMDKEKLAKAREIRLI